VLFSAPKTITYDSFKRVRFAVWNGLSASPTVASSEASTWNVTHVLPLRYMETSVYADPFVVKFSPVKRSIDTSSALTTLGPMFFFHFRCYRSPNLVFVVTCVKAYITGTEFTIHFANLIQISLLLFHRVSCTLIHLPAPLKLRPWSTSLIIIAVNIINHHHFRHLSLLRSFHHGLKLFICSIHFFQHRLAALVQPVATTSRTNWHFSIYYA